MKAVCLILIGLCLFFAPAAPVEACNYGGAAVAVAGFDPYVGPSYYNNYATTLYSGYGGPIVQTFARPVVLFDSTNLYARHVKNVNAAAAASGGASAAAAGGRGGASAASAGGFGGASAASAGGRGGASAASAGGGFRGGAAAAAGGASAAGSRSATVTTFRGPLGGSFTRARAR